MYWIELDLRKGIKLHWIYVLDSTRFNPLNQFYEIWDLLRFGNIVFMWILKFLDVFWILHKHVNKYQFHQIPLLCNHQELACTPTAAPRRVDMKEMSLIVFRKKTYWVIAKTTWKTTLVERCETAYVLLNLAEMSHMKRAST